MDRKVSRWTKYRDGQINVQVDGKVSRWIKSRDGQKRWTEKYPGLHFVHLDIFLSPCVLLCPSVHFSVHLYILSTFLSTCPFFCPSLYFVHFSVHLSIFLSISIFCPPVHFSVHLSIVHRTFGSIFFGGGVNTYPGLEYKKG